jgi:hypothetical protein
MIHVDMVETYLAVDSSGEEFLLHFWAKPGLTDEGLFSSYEAVAECVGPINSDELPIIKPGQLVKVRMYLEIVGEVEDGEKLRRGQ